MSPFFSRPPFLHHVTGDCNFHLLIPLMPRHWRGMCNEITSTSAILHCV